MDLVNDPVARALGAIIGAIGIGYGIISSWRKEAKEQAEAKRQAQNTVPVVMQGLAAAGTPMSALARDDIDKLNEMHLVGEKLIAEVQSLTAAVNAFHVSVEDARREMREEQLLEKGRREGEREALSRREKAR